MQNSLKRQHFHRMAGWAWLAANRPDVVEAIKLEALKRYPKSERRGEKTGAAEFGTALAEKAQ